MRQLQEGAGDNSQPEPWACWGRHPWACTRSPTSQLDTGYILNDGYWILNEWRKTKISCCFHVVHGERSRLLTYGKYTRPGVSIVCYSIVTYHTDILLFLLLEGQTNTRTQQHSTVGAFWDDCTKPSRANSHGWPGHGCSMKHESTACCWQAPHRQPFWSQLWKKQGANLPWFWASTDQSISSQLPVVFWTSRAWRPGCATGTPYWRSLGTFSFTQERL